MTEWEPENSSERLFKIFLRFIGTASLFALVFVAVPYSTMDAIHAWLGMGRLPTEPVVGYLARSTSAFYALVGGLLWLLSFDLRRYRSVLVYLGFAVILLGVILLAVDWAEGMPLFWKLWEGPLVIAYGLIMLCFCRAIGR